MEKITKTLAELSVAITVVGFVLALFGLVSWRWFVMPIPVALAIVVTIYIGESIYARFRN